MIWKWVPYTLIRNWFNWWRPKKNCCDRTRACICMLCAFIHLFASFYSNCNWECDDYKLSLLNYVEEGETNRKWFRTFLVRFVWIKLKTYQEYFCCKRKNCRLKTKLFERKKIKSFPWHASLVCKLC